MGAAKLGLAGASAASTPITTVGGVLGAAYLGVGAAGNFTAGSVQLIGAFTGDITGTGQMATTATTITTIGGYTALLATGGNLEKASGWANAESLGTAAFNGGFTGHIIDKAATFAQKLLLSTELGQSAADVLGLNTTGSCH